MFPRLEKIIS